MTENDNNNSMQGSNTGYYDPYQQYNDTAQQQQYQQPQYDQYQQQQYGQYQQPQYQQPQYDQYQQPQYDQYQQQQYDQYQQQQYDQYQQQQYYGGQMPDDEDDKFYTGKFPDFATLMSNIFNKANPDYNGSKVVFLDNLRANVIWAFFGGYYMVYNRVYLMPIIFSLCLSFVVGAIRGLFQGEGVVGIYTVVSGILSICTLAIWGVFTTELTRAFRCRKAHSLRQKGLSEEKIAEKMKPSFIPVIILAVVPALLCCCCFGSPFLVHLFINN